MKWRLVLLPVLAALYCGSCDVSDGCKGMTDLRSAICGFCAVSFTILCLSFVASFEK